VWVPAGVSFNGGRGVGSEPPSRFIFLDAEPPCLILPRACGAGPDFGDWADPRSDCSGGHRQSFRLLNLIIVGAEVSCIVTFI
jgi:hypothetical protein